MNTLERVASRLHQVLPGLRTQIDPPNDPDQPWWLDAEVNERGAVVEWRPHRGFGISKSSTDSYGEGPEEMAATEDEVVERLLAILTGKSTAGSVGAYSAPEQKPARSLATKKR